MQVLIVEDNTSVARFLEQAVREAGYASLVVGDGLAALEAAGLGEFDLILLDVMLPGLDGFSVSKRLREIGVRTPILILTAKDTTADKIEGLDSGADDYIVKPFHVGELLARMRALLRRGGSAPAFLTVGDLTLDPATRQASRDGKEISLSATEYALLEYLMRNAGRVLTRSMILQHVWQYDFAGTDNVLEVYISYLRRKLDAGRPVSLIRTVRGTGYKMEAP
ncbi:MAG TPA: response regulator transcription factor [Armatimonadota bacterium]